VSRPGGPADAAAVVGFIPQLTSLPLQVSSASSSDWAWVATTRSAAQS
jgi:hypothetical protein